MEFKKWITPYLDCLYSVMGKFFRLDSLRLEHKKDFWEYFKAHQHDPAASDEAEKSANELAISILKEDGQIISTEYMRYKRAMKLILSVPIGLLAAWFIGLWIRHGFLKDIDRLENRNR